MTAIAEKTDKKNLDVVIADDHQLFVESMRMLLMNIDGYKVNIAGVAYNGEQLETVLANHKPDLLLLDINIPGKNGLEVLKEVRKQLKNTRILILTMYDDAKIIKSAFDLKADGYLLKNCGREELLEAIETVLQGDIYFGKGVSVANGSGQKPEFSSFEDNFQKKFKLTKREVEILRHIARAQNNGSIAKELYISEQTAAVHRKNIMRKIGVKSTAELIRMAYDNNLI